MSHLISEWINYKLSLLESFFIPRKSQKLYNLHIFSLELLRFIELIIFNRMGCFSFNFEFENKIIIHNDFLK